MSLDDSTAQAGAWTPEATSANARKAAQDDSTIAYLGEFNSGASAVSMPILNEAGVPQNGLTNTAVGLTSDAPGSEPGEPDKYYPSGERALRADRPQGQHPGRGAGHADEAGRLQGGLHDQRQGGLRPGLARNIEIARKEQGLDPDRQRGDRQERRQLPLARVGRGEQGRRLHGLRRHHRQQRRPAVQGLLGRAARTASSTAPTASPSPGSPTPRRAASRPTWARRSRSRSPTLPAGEVPAEGQRFFDDYKTEYGDKSPDPYAIYGYEAMSLTLDAIERAADQGEVDKPRSPSSSSRRRTAQSALGTYSIDENGDTTLTDYGSYGSRTAQLVFDETIKAEDANPSGLMATLRADRPRLLSASAGWAAHGQRLLDAGLPRDRLRPECRGRRRLAERGARAASSPAEAAAGAAFVLCSLPNPAILREAIAGAGGVLAGAAPAPLIIDFSTGDPAVARELAAVPASGRVAFLDAPVSRGVVGAENGTLAVMVGGDDEALEAARPVLDHLASDIVHVGDVGAGQVTKLCNNMLTAIITTALGEVLVTGVKAGVELEPLTAALGAGSAGNFVLSGYLPNTLFTEERTAGFALSLMRKDLGLFLEAASDAGMELPLSLVTSATSTRALPASTTPTPPVIAELYERAAGVRLQLAPARQEVTT